MTSGRLPRLLRTLWYLRPAQLSGQLRRAVLPAPRPRKAGGSPPRLAVSRSVAPFLPPPAHIRVEGLRRLELLHRELCPGEAGATGIDWQAPPHGPLWAYHLHQFDWVRHPGLRADERLEAIESWRLGHRKGVGWEPFPISQRVFAWGKILATPGALPGGGAGHAPILGSLADQLATLSASLETHLLGNHYLWNLLALVFGGVLLDGAESERWRGFERPLVEELARQVSVDGMHEERCPSYQALLLESLLDLLALAGAAPERLAAATREQLAGTAGRMLGALLLLTHPDGDVALFGDSALGVAQRPEALVRYAKQLGVEARAPQPPGHLVNAGFGRLEAGPFTLLVTAAPPSPPHQPGHAHADALSFELSVGSRRVVTDTGVTAYLPGPLRDAARATCSHATVEVEGEDQAELWAAHRVGGRPDVALLRCEVEPGRGGKLEGVCAGWATPEVLHRRRFELDPEALRIVDHFDRAPRNALWSLPLAPGVEPQLEGARAVLSLEGRRLILELPPALRFRIDRGPYFPGFGRSEERAILRGEGRGVSETEIRLRLG